MTLNSVYVGVTARCILRWGDVSLSGRYRDQEEAYLQEVHLQRCGPGPASGHVLVSETLLSGAVDAAWWSAGELFTS